MRPEDAARQLSYAVDSRSDYRLTYWEAHAYDDVFADVAEAGDLSDVTRVVAAIGDRAADERPPTPEEARRIADRTLAGVLTDGGDAD